MTSSTGFRKEVVQVQRDQGFQTSSFINSLHSMVYYNRLWVPTTMNAIMTMKILKMITKMMMKKAF